MTNSFPMSKEKRERSTKLRVIDVSPVLAEAIRRTHNGLSPTLLCVILMIGESISFLFSNITGHAYDDFDD